MASYIILTPAFNEGKYIDFPIKSVLSQSIKPLQWVIVDDGSNDRTLAIIQSYMADNPWLACYQRVKPEGQAYFSSNVSAIMEGYDLVKDSDAEYVAILDADITLPETYYEEIIGKMESDPQLGIASGIYENLVDGKLCPVLSDRRSTPKAIMVFRREVFERIGGFVPLKHGGEDTAACVMTRMLGWKSWSFPDIKVIHHRPTGLGNSQSIARARFTQGLNEYGLGSHPIFVVLKALKRAVKEKPYGIGGLMRLAGYLWGCLKQEERQVPAEFVRYYRREQLKRVFGMNRAPESTKVGVF